MTLLHVDFFSDVLGLSIATDVILPQPARELPLAYGDGSCDHVWAYWDTMIQRVLAWLPLPETRTA